MTFLELALSYAARGWYVLPCYEYGTHRQKCKDAVGEGCKCPKTPLISDGLVNASKDPGQITAWWTKWPKANIAIACGLSGLAVLDVDHGLEEDSQALAWMGRNQIPPTYVVRTGRRPEMGLQFYFAGSMPDVGLFELDGCSGQVKSLGGYVMAAGSIHPDSGKAYAVKNDQPLAPLSSHIAYLKKPTATITSTPKIAKTKWSLPVRAEENRTGFLMEQGGYIRKAGCGYDAIRARMIELNEDPEIIADPVSLDRLEMAARNCSKFALPEQPPEATIGRKVQTNQGEAEVIEELDEALAEPPFPRYPIEVWDGTLYLDFARRAQERNFMPLEFLVEGALTYAGAIAGDMLRGPTDAITPRMYTVLIATAGIGKGSSFRRIRRLFYPNRLFYNVREGEMPPACSAISDASASENGLNDALLKHSRVIEEFEEMDRLMEKTEIQGSGGALMSIIRTCFDDIRPGITTSAGRKVAAELAYLSILGAITPSLWRKCMEGRDSYGSGLGGRFNLVASGEKRIEAYMPDMELGNLPDQLEAQFRMLEGGVTVPNAPDAVELLRDWWNDNSPGKAYYNRVNIIAHRKALHLTWMRGEKMITREIMADALKLGEYLVAVRDAFAVVKGEDKSAINENRVMHVLGQIAPKAVRVTKLVTLLDGLISRASIYRALESLASVGEVDKLTVRGEGRNYAVYRVSLT